MDPTHKNEAHQRGLKYYRAGNLQSALTAFTEAAQAYNESGHPAQVAEMLNNIGVVHRGLKDWDQALAAVHSAIEQFDELEDRPHIAEAFGNLGTILMEKGDHDAAVQALTRALDIYDELGDKRGRSEILRVLAEVELKRGHYVEGLLDMEAGLRDVKRPTAQQKWLRRLLRLPARLLKGG